MLFPLTDVIELSRQGDIAAANVVADVLEQLAAGNPELLDMRNAEVETG